MVRANGKGAEQGRPEDAEITLGVLSAIEAQSEISQRTLSNELGVALGLANAYLKRCVRKGYVKIQQVPRRRYTYFLTPQGFAEKARLTGEYLSSSLQFFRRARSQIDDIMGECVSRGWRRILLAGASDIAEIATVTAHDHDVELVGVLDEGLGRQTFCGLPVITSLDAIKSVDAVIVTRTGDEGRLFQALCTRLGKDRVFAPQLVRVNDMRRAARRFAREDVASAAEVQRRGRSSGG